MNAWGIPLLVGLLAGGAGVFVGSKLSASTSGTTATVADAGTSGDVLARLEVLERRPQEAPRLAGRSEATPFSVASLTDEDIAHLASRLRAHAKATGATGEDGTSPNQAVDQRLTDLGLLVDGRIHPHVAQVLAEGPADIVLPMKKTVTMDELSRELEMSTQEEDDLRAWADRYAQRMVGLLSKEGETAEDLKRRIEETKSDPAKRMQLGMELMGRVLPKLGEVMGVVSEMDAEGQKILGPDRFRRFEQEFEVPELDPLGLEDLLSDG